MAKNNALINRYKMMYQKINQIPLKCMQGLHWHFAGSMDGDSKGLMHCLLNHRKFGMNASRQTRTWSRCVLMKLELMFNERWKAMNNKSTTKDRECLHCEKFFECEGKPKDVKRCINYTERKKDNG